MERERELDRGKREKEPEHNEEEKDEGIIIDFEMHLNWLNGL